MLLNIPQDAWSTISLHLATPDILNFLSVHRNIHQYLSTSSSFWGRLLARDCDEIYSDRAKAERSVVEIRNEFMLQSYETALPAVKWLPLNINRLFPVTPREGHLACVLQGMQGYKSLVVTGGFVMYDDSVTIMRIAGGYDSYSKPWGWVSVIPVKRASFAYGATLTALPPVDSGNELVNIAKAVRFGGFQGGGYAMETNEVWMLTITDARSHENGAGIVVEWELIPTSGVPPKARAYHTATLIRDRYLLVLGGMTEAGSILDESILDTHTWTWLDISLAITGEPSPRHGHSVIWDNRRDRLVMFGGGSGRDLIRSGVENDEVWEINMRGIEVPETLQRSKMWEWNHLHGTLIDEYDDSSEESQDGDGQNEDHGHWNHLSPAESLCLGRCHNCMKVAPDTVLLMFGGSRLNTNGVLGYNLATNTFFRPNVSGVLPLPRFTGIAAYLDKEGYIFVQGGFHTRTCEAVQDITLLDVAPFLNRNFSSLQVDTGRIAHTAITDEDVLGDMFCMH